MPKPKAQQFYINVDDRRINLYIHTEMRSSSRVSIGRKGITIRLPKLLPPSLKEKQVEAFKQWAIDRIREKPELLPPSVTRNYTDGYTFTLRGKTYTLVFNEKEGKATASAKLVNGTIYINTATNATQASLQKAVPSLISRVIAKQFTRFMHNRLLELNELYFGKNIQGFRLKYTHSVWGSCSRSGNINLSTRLLFAPDEVIDYVMVHELAHMVHPNHSDQFWNEVARVMPDYKEQERWLKLNSKHCDF